MKTNKIDNLFKEKIELAEMLPGDVKWSSNDGWRSYERKYLSKFSISRKLVLFIGSTAALFLIGIFTFLIFQHQLNRTVFVENHTSEVKEVHLPDGNAVWLNRGSTLEYSAVIKKSENTISVTGEVFVDLNRSERKPYSIKAFNAIIFTNQTARFNVRAYPNEINVDVTVESGAVKIFEESYKKGLALLVTEGSYCSVHKSQKLVYAAKNKNANYLAWKTGRLVFNRLPMATVKDILEEFYQTEIELDDKKLAYCLFSGAFDHTSIDAVLNQIESELNFQITQSGTKIILSGHGCI